MPARPEAQGVLAGGLGLAKVAHADLVMGRRLGAGQYGTVWAAELRGAPVAVKLLSNPGASNKARAPPSPRHTHAPSAAVAAEATAVAAAAAAGSLRALSTGVCANCCARAQAAREFEQEAQLLAAASIHPNIVHCHAIVAEPGTLGIVTGAPPRSVWPPSTQLFTQLPHPVPQSWPRRTCARDWRTAPSSRRLCACAGRWRRHAPRPAPARPSCPAPSRAISGP